MNDANTSQDTESPQKDVWPGKLNKILIGIGVLVFGLIIADRVVEMFRAEELPDRVVIEQDAEKLPVTAVAPVDSDPEGEMMESAAAAGDVVESATAAESVAAESVITESTIATENVTAESALAESETVENVAVVAEVPDVSEDAFGSRLVFVSTSEPLYVVTEDERRFEVGSEIDDETTLAGITSQRVILEKDGNLLVIRLPDPEVQ